MIAVYLCDYELPDFMFEPITDLFKRIGFKEDEISSDSESKYLNNDKEGSVIIANGDIRIFPNLKCMEDIISRVIEYRTSLNRIDSRISIYSDITMIGGSRVDPSLYNTVIDGFRVRYAYERKRNCKPAGRTIFKLKYIGS